jgi:hypothetical protein
MTDEKSAAMRAQLDAMPIAGAKQVWDSEKGKLVELHWDREIATMPEPGVAPVSVAWPIGYDHSAAPVVVGSITFGPDKSNPCHCGNCVTMQAEVERLRAGNRNLLNERASLLVMNNELRAAQVTMAKELAAAQRWWVMEYQPDEGADIVYPWDHA